MKKTCIFLIAVLLCISACMVACGRDTDDNMEPHDSESEFMESMKGDDTSKEESSDTNTDLPKESMENPTETEYSEPEINIVQKYYEMWCNYEVMEDFIERIKITTGCDLKNKNYTWTYNAEQDRYPFEFIFPSEDGATYKKIEAVIIAAIDKGMTVYYVDVDPCIFTHVVEESTSR